MAEKPRNTNDRQMHRDWIIHPGAAGWTIEQVQAFMLGGVQAELQQVNANLAALLAILRCPAFQRIPHELRDIGMEARRQARLRRERAKRAKAQAANGGR